MNWEVMRKSGLDLHQVLLASGASNETCVYDYESARTCIDIVKDYCQKISLSVKFHRNEIIIFKLVSKI